MIDVKATQAALTITSSDGQTIKFVSHPSAGVEVSVTYRDHDDDIAHAYADFRPDDAPDALVAIQTWIEGL